MENQNLNQEQMEQKEAQGWRDVTITPDMPLAALVQFFNILNQRLCTVEDNTMVEVTDGEKLSISEIYRLQTEAEKQAQAQQENKGE